MVRLPAFVALAWAAGASSLPSVEEIVEKLRAADMVRAEQLETHTAVRRYELFNHRFHKRAQIKARVTYWRPGEKIFEVISEEGPRVICDRVLRRAMDAEAAASRGANRERARIDLANYNLRVLGTETAGDLTYYVLELELKSRSPYLIRGKAWVEASEWAIARVEGVLARKPSIWVGTPVIQQTYRKIGLFWLPEKNVSTTDAPLFGKTDLLIESSGYEIRPGLESREVARASH